MTYDVGRREWWNILNWAWCDGRCWRYIWIRILRVFIWSDKFGSKGVMEGIIIFDADISSSRMLVERFWRVCTRSVVSVMVMKDGRNATEGSNGWPVSTRKCVYVTHQFTISGKDSEIITQQLLRPSRNESNGTVVIKDDFDWFTVTYSIEMTAP